MKNRTFEEIIRAEQENRHEGGMFGIEACKRSIRFSKEELGEPYAEQLEKFVQRANEDAFFNKAMVLACYELMQEEEAEKAEANAEAQTETETETAEATESTFPVITEEAQKRYEAEAETDETPTICGYFGRGCRCMNKNADHMPCTHCPLAEVAKKAETEEATADPVEIFNEAYNSIIEDKNGNRSAWGRGVTAYALELLDSIEEAVKGGWLPLDELETAEGRKAAMLNGASDWAQYSWGGCSLIYDSDIAERLCTPSELKRTRGGEWRPNSSEEWLDTQARALRQASKRVSRALALVIGEKAKEARA